MWNDIVTLFKDYMGTGLIVILFLVAVLYLWMNEKRKSIRILFIYVPVILLLLYFNPLFASLVYGVAGSEIYYRILWLLPMTIVIAYTAVHICGKLKGKAQVLFAVAMVFVILVSGSLVYRNPFFDEADNPYHIPEEVVQICDAIEVPGREVMAVFPKELLQYVRQYSATICMPYGREMLVDRWNDKDRSFYDAMEQEQLVIEEVLPGVNQWQCHYIILPADKPIVGEPEEYGWIWFGQIGEYAIYRNTNYQLNVP